MLESVGAGDGGAGIKTVRPMMSSVAATQRLIQLSNDLSVSRSAPVSPQGQSSQSCIPSHALMIRRKIRKAFPGP